MLQKLQDVFQEIHGLPTKREIDLSLDLLPEVVIASKAPYQLNILELNELKYQLQEL
jgi:hypothetical protein